MNKLNFATLEKDMIEVIMGKLDESTKSSVRNIFIKLTD